MLQHVKCPHKCAFEQIDYRNILQRHWPFLCQRSEFQHARHVVRLQHLRRAEYPTKHLVAQPRQINNHYLEQRRPVAEIQIANLVQIFDGRFQEFLVTAYLRQCLCQLVPRQEMNALLS